MVGAAERSGVAYCNGNYRVDGEGATYTYSWPGRGLRAEQRVGLRQIELSEGEGEALADRLEAICGLQTDGEVMPPRRADGW